MQVLGFGVLVYGTFLYNEIVNMPGLKWVKRRTASEETRAEP